MFASHVRGMVAVGLLAAVALAAAGQESQRAPGVVLSLYDIGQGVPAIPELAAGQVPNEVRVLEQIVVREGQFGGLRDSFYSEIGGLLRVERAGSYAFRLISDDGSRLYIDGQAVVDHDGPHGPEPKDGTVELSAGEHELRIVHYEAGGGEHLELQWRPPGASGAAFAAIPAEALWHDASASRPTAPGRKRIIPPLRRGRPGDGTPITRPHPSTQQDIPEWKTPNSARSKFNDGIFQTMHAARRDTPEPLVAWIPGDQAAAAYTDSFVLRDSPSLGLYYFDSSGLSDLSGASEQEPFDGQLILASAEGESKRVMADLVVDLEAKESAGQGCVFRFGGPMTSRKASGKYTFEMQRVWAMTNGLLVSFTRPLDPRCGWDPDSYYIEQWPFSIAKQQPPRRDGKVYPVKSASVSEDRRSVFLEIDDLNTSNVVYLRLLPPCISEDGELPWSTEAWLTLNALSDENQPNRVGTVRPRPPQPPQNVLTDAEKAEGWRLLFDGRTTAGWRGFKRDGIPAGPDGEPGWKVIDGCLVRTGPGGDIITTEQFGNFELKIEWRISAAGNSGIFYRVGEDGELRWVWETGPEYQVLDNSEHADGRSALTSAASNYALYAPSRDATQPVGLFNEARIVVDGGRVEHWLNGEKVVEYEIGSDEWKRRVAGSKFASMPHYSTRDVGHIALQDHGDRVWYRNIKIRELPRGEPGRPRATQDGDGGRD